MTGREPVVFQDVEQCVDALIERVGKRIVLGLPLALGKAPHIANELYRRAKADSSLSLTIITALSLERPRGSSLLERRFLEPFVERIFGDFPEMEYIKDLRAGRMPDNIRVSEFYFKPASFLGNPLAQAEYICTNYTHVSRDLYAQGANVVTQLVSKADYQGEQGPERRYSLSSNPDVTLDLRALYEDQPKESDRELVMVGQVNNNLPHMVGDAELPAGAFDFVLDDPELDFTLFSSPNISISPVDHLIGLHASTLIKDGGTLQIGIGSLSDAVISSILMRHQHNDEYRALLDDLQLSEKFPVTEQLGERSEFGSGLYGDTEMLVHGYMSLYRAGILKREVYDNLVLQQLVNRGELQQPLSAESLARLVEHGMIPPLLDAPAVALLKRFGIFHQGVVFTTHPATGKGVLKVAGEQLAADLTTEAQRRRVAQRCLGESLSGGVVAHGAFFLGPQSFYQSLHELDDAERHKFCMTGVGYTNNLYGDQALKTAQRQDARFINTCMMMTLNGGAVSDGLADGQVVSGVGGQYNFVSMAHELPGARSILMLRSTRNSKGKVRSSIVHNYGHITIPRHLRDIVITEFGIADLRGKTDQQVIEALLKITDSRFQPELIASAIKAGKLPPGFQLPDAFRHNHMARFTAVLSDYQRRGHFAPFPFGHDFTPDELLLGKALKSLRQKSSNPLRIAALLASSLLLPAVPDNQKALLERMKLASPDSFKAWINQRLLVAELSRHLPPGVQGDSAGHAEPQGET